MGIIYQHIRLANAAKPQLEEIDAKALVGGVSARAARLASEVDATHNHRAQHRYEIPGRCSFVAFASGTVATNACVVGSCGPPFFTASSAVC